MKTARYFLPVAACVALMASTAANAAVTFSLTGNSSTNGTHGNARIFTGSDGITQVRATAWSISGGTVYDSFLGAYSNGLGATSGDDGTGASNTHTVDNSVRKDFILLQFNRVVRFNSGKFTTYGVLGSSIKDSDATIMFGNNPTGWMNQPGFDGQSLATLDASFSGGFTSLGTGTGGTRSLYTPAAGNFWLVGADRINADGKIDGFKFSTLVVTPSVVPEPATWTMMIGGFAMVGGALRSRRKQQAALAA